jgi:hypothetical protein
MRTPSFTSPPPRLCAQQQLAGQQEEPHSQEAQQEEGRQQEPKRLQLRQLQQAARQPEPQQLQFSSQQWGLLPLLRAVQQQELPQQVRSTQGLALRLPAPSCLRNLLPHA